MIDNEIKIKSRNNIFWKTQYQWIVKRSFNKFE